MGDNASAACSWPWTNHGDLLAAEPGNLCVVLEPVVACACLLQVVLNPLAILAILVIRFISGKHNAKVADLRSGKNQQSNTLKRAPTSLNEQRLRRVKQSEQTEQRRFAIAVLTLGFSFGTGIISELSRDGGSQWSVPPTVLGNSATMAALFMCFHMGFFLQALLFLQRYIAFSEHSARSAVAVVDRNVHEDKVLFAVTMVVLLMSNMPFIGLLAGSSLTFARYAYVLNLGSLVFVVGAVFAPRTISPTLVALQSVAGTGLETEAATLRILKMIRRLSLLTQAAKAIGLQVPLLCILVAAVPVVHNITPYLVVQSRILPTLFIVLEQIVLMPVSTKSNTQQQSSRRSSSRESSPTRRSSGFAKAGPEQAAPDTSSDSGHAPPAGQLQPQEQQQEQLEQAQQQP
jgi:hypothetical protein